MSFNTQCIKHSKLGSLSLNDIIYDLIILLIPLRETRKYKTVKNNQQYKNQAERRGLELSGAAFRFLLKIQNECHGPQTYCDGRRGPRPIIIKIFNISAPAFSTVVLSAAALS